MIGIIDDQQLRAIDALAQRDSGVVGVLIDLMERHGLRGFRRAVEVHTDGIRSNRAHLFVQRLTECIAAPEQIAQVIECQSVHPRTGFNQFAQRRREVDDRDRMALYPLCQGRRVGQGRLGRTDDFRANRQRREHIPVHRIMPQPGKQGKAVVAGKTMTADMPFDEMHQWRVMGHDPLGFAGAA
ncbi:hypothetical protein D3C84_706810 [compost metagenome]